LRAISVPAIRLRAIRVRAIRVRAIRLPRAFQPVLPRSPGGPAPPDHEFPSAEPRAASHHRLSRISRTAALVM
jgi:hypothetical protein